MKIGIIGAGLVGLGTALALVRRNPRANVVVLEKESGPARHQSGHNSGVLHAGLYYRPGSLKAQLAVAGIRSMSRFCAEQGVPHEHCGKLVVAVDESEVPRLRDLYRRGEENGLRSLRWLDGNEIRDREPNVRGTAAVLVPEEGIVDFPAAAAAIVRVVESHGGRLIFGSRVIQWKEASNHLVLGTTTGDYEFDFVINCAGLHCDRIAILSGHRPTTRIIPFRGEYFELRPSESSFVRHLVYPVPNPRFPFLGVHFTRLIRGGVEVGPNAVLAMHREGYGKLEFSPRDLAESLSYPGLWRFLLRYPGATLQELGTSISRERFVRCLQRLVPTITGADLCPGGTGVRAQAMNRDGDLVQDFEFLTGPRQLHVLNAPSPGATASLAIGEHIASRVAGS